MTPAYDIERVAAACEQLAQAIDAAARHTNPDWLSHRMAVVRTEANALKHVIEEHHE